MRVPMLREVLRVLRRRAAPEGDVVTDAQLLRRYVQTGAEPAFAELVGRHGQMVLGVCRRLLRDDHAAEDAFQATFLVLVRRAGSMRWQESIAGWLHEVARRTAGKARSRITPLPLGDRAVPAPAPAGDAGLRDVLDEALASLPAHYRNPLVLCCCEGKSNEEASRELNCPVGTVKSRLARGRELLRRRLLRRGVAVPAAALAVPWSGVTAAVGPALERAALTAAADFASRSGPALLALAVLRGFQIARVKLCFEVLLLTALLFTGVGFALGLWNQLPARSNELPAKADPQKETGTPARDALEAPLPPAAVARLGTTRFRAGGTVTSMGVSADGKKLLTLTVNNAVLLWDANNGRLLRQFPHKATVMGAVLSRDGRLVITQTAIRAGDGSTSYTTVLNVWEAAGGKRVRVIEGPGIISTFALSPDDATLALEISRPAGKKDGKPAWDSSLELRDLKTDRVLHAMGAQQVYSPTGRLVFSPDSKSLYAVGSLNQGALPTEGSILRRFDCATGTLKARTAIDGWYYSTPLLTDGRTLIMGANVWDLARGKRRPVTFKPGLDGVYALTPDGKAALVSYPGEVVAAENISSEVEPPRVVLWDLENNREIRTFPNLGGGVLGPDGTTLFTAGFEGVIRRWDLAAGGREIQPLDAPLESIRQMVFSPDNKHIVTRDTRTLRFWEVRTGKLIRRLPFDPKADINLLQFTPDGKLLLVGGRARILVHDTATWKTVSHKMPVLPLGIAENLTCALSPDGKTLATLLHSYRDISPRPITLYDWREGKVTGILRREKKDLLQVGHLHFSADGHWLISGAMPIRYGPPPKLPPDPTPFGDGSRPKTEAQSPARGEWLPSPPRIQIWSLAEKKLLRDWNTDTVGLVGIHLTRDGKTLAVSFQDGLVCLCDPATGKERLRFQHPGQRPFNFYSTLSPDGSLMATADHNGNVVRFWNLATGKQLAQCRGHLGIIQGLAFSPDGSLVATAGSDTTVLIVDFQKLLKAKN